MEASSEDDAGDGAWSWQRMNVVCDDAIGAMVSGAGTFSLFDSPS